jgi:hypothetical protein
VAQIGTEWYCVEGISCFEAALGDLRAVEIIETDWRSDSLKVSEQSNAIVDRFYADLEREQQELTTFCTLPAMSPMKSAIGATEKTSCGGSTSCGLAFGVTDWSRRKGWSARSRPFT